MGNMEQGFDLKAYLDGQVAEGRVDSEGATFTVAREQALKKLAHFALPNEYDWVLKIVQAVNLWDAPILSIRQSRVATTFFFCPPAGHDFPSESSIVSALEAATLQGALPVHQLAMALRALVQQCRLSFVLAVRQHGELGKPIYAGDDTSNLGSAARTEWTYLEREGVRLTVSHFRGEESFFGRYVPTISWTARRDVEILRVLERRCFASPVPIEVDRRLLTQVYPVGDFDADRKTRPIFTGHLQSSPDEAPRASVALVSGYHKKGPVVRPREQAQVPWFMALAPDWFTLSPTYRGIDEAVGPTLQPHLRAHTFWWVRHGVVVAKFQTGRSFARDTLVACFFPADHLRSDLSGLSVELDRKDPDGVLSAMARLNDTLANLLESGDFVRGLCSQSETHRNVPVSSETVLARAGHSIFTLSIKFAIPSARRGLVRVIDAATQVAGKRVKHDELMNSWAWHVWDETRVVVNALGQLERNLIQIEL